MNMVKIDHVKGKFTDLHTHILPGVDDGARDLETALKMLCLQKASGVERVALTPHFYPLREELQSFLERRQRAFDGLLPNWDRKTMPELRLGAEVHYSPELVEQELRCLTIGQGGYLLLELSDTAVPAHIEQVLKIMLQQGIIPILAHVERCTYFCEEPNRLTRLVELGALAQVSAKALVDRKYQKFAAACLKNGIAQIIASDAHNLRKNKFCLGDILTNEKEELLARAEEFAKAVWDNTPLPPYTIKPVKKKLFGYG